MVAKQRKKPAARIPRSRVRARKPPAAGKGRVRAVRRAMKDNKPERVKHIMRLMAEKRWVPGITGPELAEHWGCSDTAIANDSAEASRRLREGVMLDPELRDLVVVQLSDVERNAEDILRSCIKSKQFRTGVEALNTQIKAIQALAGIRGIEGPRKIEIEGNLGELLAAAAAQEQAEKLGRPGDGSSTSAPLDE